MPLARALAVLLALFGVVKVVEKVLPDKEPKAPRRRKKPKRRNGVKSLTRVMTSFDYDYDDDLRVLLVGQAKHPDTPFQLADWSVKEHMTGDWKEKVRRRIRAVDVVCVICGEHTDTARGVAAELEIAREEKKPYFLLWGRKGKVCKKPTTATASDKIYDWTWDNLKALIGGAR